MTINLTINSAQIEARGGGETFHFPSEDLFSPDAVVFRSRTLDDDPKSYDKMQQVQTKLILTTQFGTIFPPKEAKFHQPAAPILLSRSTTYLLNGNILTEPRHWRPRPPTPVVLEELTEDEFIETLVNRKRLKH